ncbi:BrnT family toxin [Caulobacter segnis]
MDFADAPSVFQKAKFTLTDDRKDYGEERYLTVGFLDGRMVAIVWTPRGETRRIISMRKCNAREQDEFGKRLDRSG